jgi:type III secretion system FlhB-like substrate exporter
MRSNDTFLEIKGFGDLARKLVEKMKDVRYPLVYLLVKLILTLHVTTAIVERIFSAMKYVKNKLCN